MKGSKGSVTVTPQLAREISAALANALVLAPGDEALELAERSEELARGPTMTKRGSRVRRMVLGIAIARESRRALPRLVGRSRRARAAGRPDWEFTCGYLFGEGLLESGDLDGAGVEFEKAASIPSVLIGWAPVVFAASRAIAASRLDEAEELVERAHQLGAALGETNDVIRWCQRFMVEMARARYDDTFALIERLEHTLFGTALGWRMLALVGVGDHSGAVAFHAAWVRDVRGLVPQVVIPWALEAEVSVAFGAHDGHIAERLRDEVARYEGHFLGGDTTLVGTGEHLMGRVAFAEERYNDAVGLLDRSLEMVDRWDLHLLVTTDRSTSLERCSRATAPATRTGRIAAGQALETSEALGLVAAGDEARSLRT